MSGLDFLALVLQRSNSFDLKAFFSIFRRFISSWLPRPSSIVAFEGRVFNWVVWSRLRSVFFVLSEIVNWFFRESLFRKALHFFLLFVCNLSLYLAPPCGSPANVSHFVITSQDYIKVEHVRT